MFLCDVSAQGPGLSPAGRHPLYLKGCAMILADPAVDMAPIPFHGTVDVYEAWGKWIARMWPRPPHHPRTPAQLASWDRFASMIQYRKTLPKLCVNMWKSVNTAPNRSYDDLLRSTILKVLKIKSDNSAYSGTRVICRHEIWNWKSFEGILYWFVDKYIHVYSPLWNFTSPLISRPQLYYSPSASSVIDWSINGYLCYKGRKHEPHYVPSVSSAIPIPFSEYPYPLSSRVYFYIENKRYVYPYTMVVIHPDYCVVYRQSMFTDVSQAVAFAKEPLSLFGISSYSTPDHTLSSYVIDPPPAQLPQSLLDSQIIHGECTALAEYTVS